MFCYSYVKYMVGSKSLNLARCMGVDGVVTLGLNDNALDTTDPLSLRRITRSELLKLSNFP